MIRIGLIREEKTPPDTRVALTPRQCRHLLDENPGLDIVVEPSPNRCFPDSDYEAAGIRLSTDLSNCDILLGIKEVPVDKLIPGKTYLFFSHTKKKQPYNQKLMHALIEKKIRLVDYECLTHADGQRILGFGFYAGLVGAHNGLLTYGRKFGAFDLNAAHELGSYEALKEAYLDLKLPNLKIVVTGSGKVASGIVEVMDLLDVDYVEPEDFLLNEYEYPVYTHVKGHTLYVRKDDGTYHRDDFHEHPGDYRCIFDPFLSGADILMNGVYWDKNVPRLFEKTDVLRPDLRLHVISDITCDVDGSVPINAGASTIADPVYGIVRSSLERVAPFQDTREIIDVMAVDNLPNELPRDASEHFGNHLEKYILPELLKEEGSELIDRGTICSGGRLTAQFEYLSDYAY